MSVELISLVALPGRMNATDSAMLATSCGPNPSPTRELSTIEAGSAVEAVTPASARSDIPTFPSCVSGSCTDANSLIAAISTLSIASEEPRFSAIGIVSAALVPIDAENDSTIASTSMADLPNRLVTISDNAEISPAPSPSAVDRSAAASTTSARANPDPANCSADIAKESPVEWPWRMFELIGTASPIPASVDDLTA